MPWGWGKKEAPSGSPPASDEARGASSGGSDGPAPLPPNAPLPSTARFRVDDVYTITGLGLVLVGEVEEGTIRVPTPMRLVRIVDGAEVAVPVQVVQADAHHRPITEVRPGTPAGLVVRGVPAERSPLARHRHAVAKGDRLVSP